MQFILGYICAIFVGISLGVLGSGGSILTVPIMVYLMHVQPSDAIIYSLFVVGCTSAVGGLSYVRKKLVDWHIALVFAIPSVIIVFITRKFILPLIPDPVFTSVVLITRDQLIMILFSILMVIAGYRMMNPVRLSPNINADKVRLYNYPWLIFVGLLSGLLTGIFGVGGGFIIIPALVLFAKVPIHMSVGTSLLIIAFNSFTGFGEELLQRNSELDFKFLLSFAIMSAIGIFLGYRISIRLKAGQLRKIFGWFILITGLVIILKEFMSL